MRGLNKVILIGNATRDAELRQTNTGKPVSHIRLATNRMVRGEEKTQYHDIVCWDKLAEQTGKYVTKGRLLYVEGRLEYRKFTDTEGNERLIAEVIASDVSFLSSRPGEKQPEASEDTAPAEDDLNVEDIPF
jgi:single-strand DNA-binding protein